MAENILAMTLRIRNHAVTQTRLMGTELRALGGHARHFGTQFGQALKGANVGMDGFLAKMVSVKQLIILTFAVKAVQKFVGFLASLTKATDAQTSATVRLAKNMASFGNYSRANMEELIQLSTQLQRLTGVQDNVIMDNMALLASFGMEAAMIKQLTPLVLDFAKAKGMDLEAAYKMVGKASIGAFQAMNREGVILDKNASKKEKMVILLKYLGQYMGTAEALAQTYGGQMAILSAIYDDTKESMGSVIQQTIMQSGALPKLMGILESSIAWWDKYGMAIAKVASTGVSKLVNGMLWLQKIISSDASLWFFSQLVQILKAAFYMGKITFDIIKKGLLDMSDILSLVVAKGIQFWKWIFGSKEDYEQAKQVADQVLSSFWTNIDERSKKLDSSLATSMNGLLDSLSIFGNNFTFEGFDNFKKSIVENSQKLGLLGKIGKDAFTGITNGAGGVNTELAKTFQLTKQMAAQFATASRVEQEQTKYLMQKLKNLTPEGVGGLSEQEKKLIDKQDVLKKAYENIFNEYAEKQLGIKSDNKDGTQVKINIDLTEEAKKILKASGDDKKQFRNVSYENSLAG